MCVVGMGYGSYRRCGGSWNELNCFPPVFPVLLRFSTAKNTPTETNPAANTNIKTVALSIEYSFSPSLQTTTTGFHPLYGVAVEDTTGHNACVMLKTRIASTMREMPT